MDQEFKNKAQKAKNEISFCVLESEKPIKCDEK